MSVSERNPCIATKKEVEPREPVVTYNGEDRSEAKLRAGVGACFCCLRHFETMRHFCATLYATPPGFAFVFLGGGSRGSAPCGAPPPGYFISPLRGSNLGSRLRVSLHSLATPWLAPTAHANVRCHSRERLGLTPLHANARCRSRERSA